MKWLCLFFVKHKNGAYFFYNVFLGSSFVSLFFAFSLFKFWQCMRLHTYGVRYKVNDKQWKWKQKDTGYQCLQFHPNQTTVICMYVHAHSVLAIKCVLSSKSKLSIFLGLNKWYSEISVVPDNVNQYKIYTSVHT